jgi:outer membrane protein OmpA-like peptidoglycan-associated protein
MSVPFRSKQHAKPSHLLLLPLLAAWLQATAQNTPPPSTEGPNIFVGDTARLSIGTSGAGRMHGEIGGVLHETDRQAWLGELWLANSAGGIKLSHHRLHQDTVHKVFVAHDQNPTRDHKLTLGYGQERSNWFGNINLSLGTTGRRLVSDQTTTQVTQQSGTTPTGTYIDTITLATQTRFFDRAYNQGLGLRAGRYSETLDLRLSVGYDHEWGKGSARQDTVSLLAEKGFTGTPHSLALQLSHKNRSGDANSTGNASSQALLVYRYSLGGVNHRPEKSFVVTPTQPPALTPVPLATPVPAPAAAPTQAAPAAPAPVKEARWVKTKATMSGDALFDFNSASLTPASRTELNRIATLLQQQGREGNIRITGHTCDIGSDRVNDRLSLQRAESVRNYLVGTGAVPADATEVIGKGKREQKFPATEATRAQNRRVELEFFSFTTQQEWVEVPQAAVAPAPVAAPQPAPAPTVAPNVAPVVYERRLIDQPPAWSQRALRTPAAHKRDVDVYRVKEETQRETRERENIERPNNAPTAANDTFWVSGRTPSTLNVLGNDTDPDGDTIRIISVTQPIEGVGTVEIIGNEIKFTPFRIFGVDNFSYTISDDRGATSTANVLLIDP